MIPDDLQFFLLILPAAKERVVEIQASGTLLDLNSAPLSEKRTRWFADRQSMRRWISGVSDAKVNCSSQQGESCCVCILHG
jgi:hypothetical protein